MKNKFGWFNIKAIKSILSVLLFISFIFLTFNYFNGEMILNALKNVIVSPLALVNILLFYFLAFLLRAIAWKVYLGDKVNLFRCLNGILYSLLLNHLFPIKIGDFARVGVVSYKSKISVAKATESVIIMRILDLIILLIYASLGLFLLLGIYKQPQIFLGIIILLVIFGSILLKVFAKNTKVSTHYDEIKSIVISLKGFYIILLVAFSWIFEGIVVFEVASTLGVHLTFINSVWINSITVAGQVFQITPGGIGTYEATLSWALMSLKLEPSLAYTVAIVSHATKFLFSYSTGIIIVLLSPISYKQIIYWLKGVRT